MRVGYSISYEPNCREISNNLCVLLATNNRSRSLLPGTQLPAVEVVQTDQLEALQTIGIVPSEDLANGWFVKNTQRAELRCFTVQHLVQ